MIKKTDSNIAQRLRSSANKAEASTGNATQINTPTVKKRILKLKEKQHSLTIKTSPNLKIGISLKQKVAKIVKPVKPPKALKIKNIYDED